MTFALLGENEKLLDIDKKKVRILSFRNERIYYSAENYASLLFMKHTLKNI